ncbi:MAG TPA: peptidoglycan-binding domain-containing protein [Devosia sp.]|nr:peptidoglycan-binding domain-containing protein [Devosia sp.]
MRLFQLLILFLLVTVPIAAAMAQDTGAAPAITADAVNGADLSALPAGLPLPADETGSGAAPPSASPDPAIVKLQILLDRAGASPGVIDGFDGDNVRKAIWAYQTMKGRPADGTVTADLLAGMQTSEPVIGSYTITAEDVAAIGPQVPEDYAEKAKMKFLGYSSVTEEFGRALSHG